MGNAVMKKVIKLDEIDLNLITALTSLVSIIYDGGLQNDADLLLLQHSIHLLAT